MTDRIRWDRLPVAASLPTARDWLLRQADSGLSPTTVDAYSRAVERYLARCRELRLNPGSATTADLANYLSELGAAGLGEAAVRQRYAAIRLFYAWVVERGERPDNPLGSGLPRSGRTEPGGRRRGPWLPDEAEWRSIVRCAASEPPRTRLMVAVAYLGALRREDVCRVEASGPDLRHHRVRLPTASTPRSITITPAVAERIEDCLRPDRTPALLFRSQSRRNPRQPISVWTWAKLARHIADRSGVPRFTPATLRHLRLVDLAADGGSAGEIARLAGYRSTRLVHRYVRAAGEPGVTGAAAREEQIDLLVRGRAW